MLQDPTFWTATAFIGFVALIFALNVPSAIFEFLDSRSKKIKNDLDEAESLVKDAQDLLATYQKKQRDAGNEAGTMALNARDEAEQIIENGRKQLESNLERRQQLVLARIERAEMSAIEKIRLKTVDIAMEATTKILKADIVSANVHLMVDTAIKELPKNIEKQK